MCEQIIMGIRNMGLRPADHMSRDARSWVGYALRLIMAENVEAALFEATETVRLGSEDNWFALTTKVVQLCYNMGSRLCRTDTKQTGSDNNFEVLLSDNP